MTAIGIEVGTSKSCFGFEKAKDIKIIPNALGEEIIPSVVSFKDSKILAGIDATFFKISNFNNTISEVKRLLGKNFYIDDKQFQNYKKYLSYDLIEEENKPILIKIKEEIYTPEEIYAFIIKKLIEEGSNYDVFTRKAVITIPTCFGLIKRQLIKKAAKLAGIDESRLQIINESYASALAFEIFINKNSQKSNLENYEYNYNIFLRKHKTKIIEDSDSSPLSLINNSNKLTIIFDLGGGCFDLTLLSIEKKNNELHFEIKASLGDPNFGCIDFDNKLVDYCINEFCKETKIDKNIIYKDKKAIQRLKYKCEFAKKILSRNENAVINVDDFINNEDLCSHITIKTFDEICGDLYKKIINKIDKLFKICQLSINDINEVLVIGGSTKIPKIIQILNDKFTKKKIISNLDKDKIVICGAVLYACELKKKKKTIILNDTLPLSVGIEVINNDFKSFLKYGNKMNIIIKQNSKLPINAKKQFKSKIGKNKTIYINFYEGLNKYVKYNQKIYELKLEIPNAEDGNIIIFDVSIEVDSNYILKIIINVPSFGITKEIEIGKFNKDEKIKLKKKLKSSEIKFDFAKARNEQIEYSEQIEIFQDEEDKNNALINCCKCCDVILDEYEKNYYKEDVIENIFLTTRDLFLYYLQRLKLKNKKINDNDDIILKIKEKMKNIIRSLGYVERLLDIFKDIYITDKNIFYEIMVNYMELMNNEGVNLLLKPKKTRLYYSKIYFESCALVIKDIEKELDLSGINEELNQKYQIQKKINELSIEIINSRERQNKSLSFKSLKNIVDSINNKNYKWLKNTISMINELEKKYESLNMNQ